MARTPFLARRKTLVAAGGQRLTLPPPPLLRRRGPRGLTAAARPLDLSDATEGKRLSALRGQQMWQGEAWAYRRSLGELRYATAYLGNSAQRMRLFPATIVDNTVVPIDDVPGIPDNIKSICHAALHDLGVGPTGVGPILKSLMENFEVAGECFLVGNDDMFTGKRTYAIRSTSETTTKENGQIGFRDLPGGSSVYGSSTDPTSVQWADPANTFVTRLWWPDPEFSALADSPVRAVLDILEELLLLGRDVRATARSRLANNGMLLIPEGLNVVPQHATLIDGANGFLDELMEAATSALTDEGSAAAVVPLLVQGPLDQLAGVRHITLDRVNNKDGVANREELIGRLATGIDLPAEVLTGKIDLNHWTAWQVDDDSFRHHIEPLVIVMVDALTQGYYWPTIEAMGLAQQINPADMSGIFLWYDPTELVTHPDRTQDALNLWDRFAISDGALRKYGGFPDSDKPADDEVLLRIVTHLRTIDPATSTALLRKFDPTLPEPAPTVVPPAPASPADPMPTAVPAKPAGPPPSQGGTVPPRPSAVAASAANARLLQEARMQARIARAHAELAMNAFRRPAVALPPAIMSHQRPNAQVEAANRQLLAIDRELRARLLVASNNAVKQALSRAGAKIATKSRTASAGVIKQSIVDVPQWQIPATVGPALWAAVGFDPATAVTDSTFADLQTQWDTWVKTGQDQALRAAARIAGLDVNTAFAQIKYKFADDAAKGWDLLAKSLTSRTNELLRSTGGSVIDGVLSADAVEVTADSMVMPGVIRAALALAGGFGDSPSSSGLGPDGTPVDPAEPMGQIGTGDTISEVLTESGAAVEAYQWVHGPAANPFEPHVALDGVTFTDFTDSALATGGSFVGNYYIPGDHAGCTCDFMPVWLPPTDVAAADSTDMMQATPEQMANTLVTAAQQAEPALTAAMQSLADQYGGELAGLDFRLKTEDSLARKISADVAATGDTPEQIAAKMFDVNRYTIKFDDPRYTGGTQSVLDDLRGDGYQTKVKNFWDNDNNPYQGVNVQLVSPQGQQFELQFHTGDSLAVKEGELHHLYELARVETDPAKIAEYQDQMAEVAAKIPVPAGIRKVK